MPLLRTSCKWKLNGIKSFTTKLCEKPKSVSNETMTAWHINSYGKLNKLEMGPVEKPIVSKPKQVLVKVNAASVNPIDVAMLGGYGNVVLDLMRKFDPCDQKPSFPLILGRDFSGEVISKGADVRSEIKVGETVYGVVPVHSQGSHSEFVLAEECLLARKPDHLSDEEASGILYAAMTAWSALKITGDLFITGASGKKVLVIGGSGGVGSSAIQLLKAWGAEVTATCRDDAVPLVEKLGADYVVDYAQPNWLRDLQTCGKFDIILDASGNITPSVYIPMLSEWKNAKFITLKSPLLKNTDSFGLVRGMVQNLGDLVASNLNTGAIKKGTTVRWGYFLPVPAGIREISNLVNQKQLTPVVDKVFPFAEVPAAFDKVIEGHLRGKIIVSALKNQGNNENTVKTH